MLSSTPSPQSSKRGERISRSTTPTFSNTPSDDLPELSDVPCYTCRRRHVKCDRILPHCAKCAKKGVPCLGYQKPLRWADGVAVRGKLKGKAQPVVDSKVANIVRTTLQLPSNSAMKEAEHFGIPATVSGGVPCLQDPAACTKLITYHNNRICAEQVTCDQSKFINRGIAPLTPEIVGKLPTDILTCILANAAVHMASRNPGNRPLEQLALETKVSVYQNFNRQLQNPQTQLPDVLVACCALIFSMDLIEYGMSRWMVHLLGSINVVGSFGGPENLFTYYPHLQLNLTHMAYFETMWIVLCHVPVAKPKQATRKTLEMLCHTSSVNQKFFNPCPAPLTLAVWDIGACAHKVLMNRTSMSVVDLHKREQILRSVLAFQPADDSKNIQETYDTGVSFTNTRLTTWTVIASAWKGAVTLLVLRYLYFGRPNLVPHSHSRHSSGASLAAHSDGWLTPRDELTVNYQVDEWPFLDFAGSSMDPWNLTDDLSLGLILNDPLSRSPSPMPSPLLNTEPPSSELWDKRYEIHDEAFNALASSLLALYDELDPSCIRYIILPLLILSLLSRPDSDDRRLCLAYFNKFDDFMVKNCPRETAATATQTSCPIGGEGLKFDVPWEKLDAFSAAAERDGRYYALENERLQRGTAAEWNWWDMLKYTNMNLIWPVNAGTSHMERGSEFLAFQLLSSVVNEECFSAWTQDSTASQASSSSSFTG